MHSAHHVIKRMVNHRLLSHMASCDVASNICQVLPWATSQRTKCRAGSHGRAWLKLRATSYNATCLKKRGSKLRYTTHLLARLLGPGRNCSPHHGMPFYTSRSNRPKRVARRGGRHYARPYQLGVVKQREARGVRLHLLGPRRMCSPRPRQATLNPGLLRCKQHRARAMSAGPTSAARHVAGMSLFHSARVSAVDTGGILSTSLTRVSQNLWVVPTCPVSLALFFNSRR